ncbi:MAG: AzlC family ABC transporter permease [Coriobacteriia bacterium]|nr:AzlC family ABC transporter permease [Coriobacteriia bacterium]
MVFSRNIELKQFRAGLRSGFPIFLGYLPVGIAYGILTVNFGFTPIQAILASALALSGVGQFVALSTLALSESVMASILASTIVNLRYILFSASLSPHLQGLKMRILAGIGFTTTDESFAINSTEIRELRASPHSMFGVGAIGWLGWVLGTGIGTIGAQFLGDLSAWGIYFAIPAMYAALFVALANNRKQVYCGLGAAAITLGLYGLTLLGLQLETYWFTIITALIAATLAVLIFPDKGDNSDGVQVNTDKDIKAAEAAEGVHS